MIQTSRRDDAVIRRITADAQLEEQAAMMGGADEQADRATNNPQDTLEKSEDSLPPSPPTPPEEENATNLTTADVEKAKKNDDKGDS